MPLSPYLVTHSCKGQIQFGPQDIAESMENREGGVAERDMMISLETGTREGNEQGMEVASLVQRREVQFQEVGWGGAVHGQEDNDEQFTLGNLSRELHGPSFHSTRAHFLLPDVFM